MTRLIKGARVEKRDVSKYTHVDTGTAGKPQKQTAKMKEGATRVQSGGVTDHPVQGSPSRSKVRMKKVRVTGGHTSSY